MRTLREWIHRLAGTLRRRRTDSDLEEELQLHAELAAEAAQRQGIRGPRQAVPGDSVAEEGVRTARIRIGGTSQAMEALRDQRGLPWLHDLGRDVRHGLRSLGRTPLFTAVALITLALGIGANTAIFSIVNGVLLRPLGYPEPERLVAVLVRWSQIQAPPVLSAPEYEELRDATRAFAHVGAYVTSEANLSTPDRPLRVRAVRVDEHLLAALALQPAQGRFFVAGETDAPNGEPAAPPIAMLSHELWQTAFGGQSLVGRTVPIDGRAHEIIGIMPPGADLLDAHPEIWLPLGITVDDRRSRGGHDFLVVGRLRDGVTLQEARSELNGFLENWSGRFGVTGAGLFGHVPSIRGSQADAHSLEIEPVRNAIVGDAGRAIWVLQVVVGLVLLIACANLANLIIARAEFRRREFAVRAAVGASRGRLLRQVMTEGLLLSFGGGMLGVWVAAAGIEAVTRVYPDSLPRTSEVGVDVRVLLFALAVSVATGVLFGLVPVAQRRVAGLVTALKEGDRSAGVAGRHRMRRGLVVVEVALAVMVTIGAGLLIRTFHNLTRVDPGFDRSRRVTFSVTLPAAITDPDTRVVPFAELLQKIRAVPGVQAATGMSGLPFNDENLERATRIENYTSPSGESWEVILHQRVMTDYFETMGIAIVDGRGFDRTDVASPGGVVVINETLANRVWKGQNPIGQRLKPNFNGIDALPWHTVIGVARDVRQDEVDRAPQPELYVLIEEIANAPATLNVVLRTTMEPAGLSQTLAGLVRDVDPAVPIVRLRDMDAVFADAIRRPKLLAQMLGAFAGLALLLAALGTYGVLSYTVAERRREIGIRVALGAGRSTVLAHVMTQGLIPAGIGLTVGLAAALGMNRLVASLLFGVEPTDPATFAGVVVAMAAVACVACWLPAWRASQLDPNLVLRAE